MLNIGLIFTTVTVNQPRGPRRTLRCDGCRRTLSTFDNYGTNFRKKSSSVSFSVGYGRKNRNTKVLSVGSDEPSEQAEEKDSEMRI